ncbi:MAG: hypothetical protein K8R87_07505 [Verrucomicrobia bacterium]|nr:hypothetical protein [Verrucomicrobiota bacterium]
MPDLNKVPTGKFNPGYGCAIFAMMILTFGGIVTWVIHSLLEQNRQIAGFTVEQAEPMPALGASDNDKEALREKLSAFAVAVEKGGAAHLELSVADCNVMLALATDAGIGGDKESTPYPDLLRFTGFDAQSRVLQSEIRLPMNKLPWQDGKRFLVGSATFRPEIDNGSLILKIEGVSVPGKPVPEGFVRNLKIWDWLDVAKKKNTHIADALKKITAWRITENGAFLVLDSQGSSH